MDVKVADNSTTWNKFVSDQPEATLFHSYQWADILHRGAQHKPYFLCALKDNEITGVLPICLVESRLFGRFLISLPHYMGGICALDSAIESALLQKATELRQELRASFLEVRGNKALVSAEKHGYSSDRHKASFLIDLLPGEDSIWQNLRKQTRNRIRKGRSLDLSFDAGHHLLKDFCHIFSLNTRAIGSLTFSPKFFNAILEYFGESAQILVARYENRTIAAKLVVRFKDTLTMLWGATLPDQKTTGANYFLTWETLCYALSLGCHTLDMGRSSVGSGPYNFKAHWGGKELRHFFYMLDEKNSGINLRAESPRFRLARSVWKKLPLAVTRTVGPWIARQIP